MVDHRTTGTLVETLRQLQCSARWRKVQPFNETEKLRGRYEDVELSWSVDFALVDPSPPMQQISQTPRRRHPASRRRDFVSA